MVAAVVIARRNGIEAAETGEIAAGMLAGLDGALRQFHLWRARRRARRDLARMTAHMLRDIGLTPGEAADEAAKPFWRA